MTITTVKQIKFHISRGETDEAIALLIADEKTANDGLLLSARLSGINKQYGKGLIDYSTKSLEISRITDAVMTAIKRYDTDVSISGTGNVVLIGNNASNISINQTSVYAFNFGDPLTDIEQVRKIYDKLETRLADSELTANEVKDFCVSLYIATKEKVFKEIRRAIEDVQDEYGNVDVAITEAVARLVALKDDVITFFRDQNKEAKTKSIHTYLSEFSDRPSQETWTAFKTEAERVFESKAFYNDAIREALDSLLSERPTLEGFGYAAKVEGYVSRVSVWLRANYKQ